MEQPPLRLSARDPWMRASFERFLNVLPVPCLLDPGEELLRPHRKTRSECNEGRLRFRLGERLPDLSCTRGWSRRGAPCRLEVVVARFRSASRADAAARMARPEIRRDGAAARRLVFRSDSGNTDSRIPSWNVTEIMLNRTWEQHLSPAFPRAFLRQGKIRHRRDRPGRAPEGMTRRLYPPFGLYLARLSAPAGALEWRSSA